ncbi:MAG: type IV pilus assembly protein PilM [Eubacteriales bacterium]|nr:type IV pilus assembly protein PilM [Eubacteriales bacterium]
MAVIQKNMIGIDIGAKSIKMVSVNRQGKITRYSYSEVPEGVISEGKIESKQIFLQAIREAKKKLRSAQKTCAVTISCCDIVIRRIMIPLMEQENIPGSIALELSDFLPADTDRYSIDYTILDKVETEDRKELMLSVFATPVERVESYVACLKEAGFKVKYVDAMENAYEKLHKFLLASNKTAASSFACLCVDSSHTSVCIYGNSRLFISKAINTGVKRICKEIADKIGQPVEIVERFIFKNDTLRYGETLNTKKKIIETFVKEMSSEVLRVIDYYKSKAEESDIEIIYLSGGLSHIQDIAALLKESLGISVACMHEYVETFYKYVPRKHTGFEYTNAFAVTFREDGRR